MKKFEKEKPLESDGRPVAVSPADRDHFGITSGLAPAREAAAIDQLRRDFAKSLLIFEAIAGRLTDCSHVTVEEASNIEQVSTKTIRNWIKKGVFTLEVVPGTRKSGIPVEQLCRGWVSIRAARRADRAKAKNR